MWINVKERLPEEGVRVLIYRKQDGLSEDYIVYINDNEPIWARLLDEEMTRVTHWMPLPLPPQET